MTNWKLEKTNKTEVPLPNNSESVNLNYKNSVVDPRECAKQNQKNNNPTPYLSKRVSI